MRQLLFILPLAFTFISTANTSDALSDMSEGTRSRTLKAENQSGSVSSLFKPVPNRKTKINYAAWDDFLKKTVLPTGPSTRQYARTIAPQTGTRIPSGHVSKLRLEGNKIILSRFTKAHRDRVGNFRRELEDLANQHDITTFAKAEQLAFWINLHNAALIETLAQNYPLRKPSEFVVPEHNELLHDAKILRIKNTPLSLRDIREKIVYSHWNDAKVFYGFSLGDIASPSLQNQAFTSSNVDNLLEENANEFVNSLRGYRQGKVSKLYNDISRFYFENYEQDLSAHFDAYMRDDVKVELVEYGIQGTSSYEKQIADLTGGTSAGVSSMNLTSYQVSGGYYGAVSLGGATADTNVVSSNTDESNLRQFHGAIGSISVDFSRKANDLKRMGISNSGAVIIEDVETRKSD